MRDALYSLPPANLPDTPATRRDMAAYKASARALDQGVGTVLDAIEDENTLVIFTTDHGLAFPGAKATLTDRGIGVLLIVRGPGGFTGGRVSDALVSQVDLFPTICDLLGLERPEWVRGRSLLPLARKEADEVNDAVFAEITFHAAYEPQRAVRTKRYKYIRRYERARARQHRRQPQQGLPAGPRAGRARRARRSSSTTSSSIPTRRTISSTRSPRSLAELRERLQRVDGGDRRPAARRPGRPGAGHGVQHGRPALARRTRRRGPDGARDRPPDASRRARRAARRVGGQARDRAGRSCASTSREPTRIRAIPTSSSRSAPAPPPPAAGRSGWSARSSGCARPTPPALPVLGICFGAQALAAALGGCVHKLERPSSAGSRSTAVDADRVPAGPWMAWHEDGFTLPPLAYELASQRVRRAGVLPLPAPRGAVPSRGHARDRPRLGGQRPRRPRARGHHARGARARPRGGTRPPPRGPPRRLFDGFAARAGLVAVASRV